MREDTEDTRGRFCVGVLVRCVGKADATLIDNLDGTLLQNQNFYLTFFPKIKYLGGSQNENIS